jgi:hypothetical protein
MNDFILYKIDKKKKHTETKKNENARILNDCFFSKLIG